VVETLIVDREPLVLGDEARYARMRNVHCVPTVAILSDWLAQVGFTDIRIVDVTATTTDEQRRTEWMRFESLAEALDPGDASRTVEGYPAPRRAIAIGRAS
jgi:tRNA (mo5U34)-methyltransferase